MQQERDVSEKEFPSHRPRLAPRDYEKQRTCEHRCAYRNHELFLKSRAVSSASSTPRRATHAHARPAARLERVRAARRRPTARPRALAPHRRYVGGDRAAPRRSAPGDLPRRVRPRVPGQPHGVQRRVPVRALARGVTQRAHHAPAGDVLPPSQAAPPRARGAPGPDLGAVPVSPRAVLLRSREASGGGARSRRRCRRTRERASRACIFPRRNQGGSGRIGRRLRSERRRGVLSAGPGVQRNRPPRRRRRELRDGDVPRPVHVERPRGALRAGRGERGARRRGALLRRRWRRRRARGVPHPPRAGGVPRGAAGRDAGREAPFVPGKLF